MPPGISIKLADPSLTSREEAAAAAVLRSGNLVAGARVEEFESELCRIAGRSHAVAVSSGTAALLCGMHALGIGQGSVVAIPALTFPAPALAAAFLGAEVRACDVDPATFNLSRRTLGPVLSDDVSLVVAIDQFGAPAPVAEIEEAVAGRGIPVLVDAACSLGSSMGGRPCGSFGLAATLSFHPRKVITTGEGGAVVTDDGDLAAKVRSFRNLGLRDGVFGGIGLNLRPSEIGAAVGLEQIRRFGEILSRRRDLARRYRDLPLRFQEIVPKAVHNVQTVAAVLPEGAGERADLVARCRHQGVEIGIASYCLGALPFLRQRFGLDPASTPEALAVHERGIALPLHVGLAEGDVDRVAAMVHDWLKGRGGRS